MKIVNLKEFKQSKLPKSHRSAAKKTFSEPTKNFYRVSHEAVTHKVFITQSTSAKLIWFYLCHARNRYQRNKDYFTRSDRQIMKDTGLSRNTVKKGRRELEYNRFIVTNCKKGGRRKYHIFEPEQAR